MTPVRCSCGRTILLKPEWAGFAVRCSGCGSPVDPARASEALPAVASEIRRPCPSCGGRILAQARKCRFCGCALDGPSPAPRPTTDAGGVGVLVVGILAWLFWMPGFFLFPIVWAWGHAYERDCRAKGLHPSGAGRTGRILGLIGTIVAGIAVLCLGLFLVLLATGRIR